MKVYLTECDYKIANENGIDRLLVYRRVYECGWEIERAITERVNDKYSPTGEWHKWKDVAVVSHGTYRVRRMRGMTEAEAALTPKKRKVKKSIA